MFRSKRSAPSYITNNNPTSSAATAAAQAVLRHQPSGASLSAAAAAAAIRSHATSPVPVGEIQTKRMIRRGSTSSYGSGAGSLRQPFSSGMQRRGSSASIMSDRSFRSPSPGGTKLPSVPALPNSIPPVPARSYMRSTSLERPMRVTSPTPPSGENGATVDRDARVPAPKKGAMQSTALPKVWEQPSPEIDEARDSLMSINYWRPMSPPLISSAAAQKTRQEVQIRPASSLGFSEPSRIQQQRQNGPLTRAQNIDPYRDKSHPPHAGMVWVPTASAIATRSSLATRSTIPGHSSRPTSPGISSRPQSPVIGGEGALTITKRRSNLVVANSQRRQPLSPGSQRSTISVPRPSEAEIKSFQARAASLLARPLSDATSLQSNIVRKPGASKLAQGSQVLTTPAAQARIPNNIATNQHARSASQPVSSLSAVGISNGKGTISPKPSAQFSRSVLLDTLRHQPPLRSMSPAKSALKGHSPRPSSPEGSTQEAPSDASDARSIKSDDGMIPTSRKKKSARVTFDDRPILVGRAAPQDSSVDMALSPQYKKNLSNGFNSVDNGLSPRPLLPSFGSAGNYETSNDHALAGVLTQHFASKSAHLGAQGLDASESNTSTMTRVPSMREYLTDKNTPRSMAIPSMKEYLEAKRVPSITVQPASPGIEEIGSEFGVPARASRNSESALPSTRSGNTLHSQSNRLAQSASYNGDLAREESDGAAQLYTDAAEDQAGLDNAEGFVSLNAMLKRPNPEAHAHIIATSWAPGAPLTAPQPKGIALPVADDNSEKDENWDVVRAYWSGLSVQRKQQIERESQPIEGKQSAKSPPDAKQSIPNQRKKISTGAQIMNGPAAAGESFPPWPDQLYQQSVKEKVPPMKSSMRVSHERATSEPNHVRQSMRQSMRSPNELVHPRSSSGNTTSKPSLQIPVSERSANGGLSPASSLAKNVVRPGSAMSKSKQPTKAPLNRTASGDSSASESSFRKKRRGSPSTAHGRHTMKRSMRGSNDTNAILNSRPMSPISSKPTRFSLRAPSPSGSLSAARMPVRTSVHSSAGEIRPSREPSRFSSFGKSSKPKSAMRKAPTNLVSRFADSSDEEDERPAFRSRFNDSDDEGDRATKLTPVRGIPRKPGQQDGESTDLSDEEVLSHSAPTNNTFAASESYSKTNGNSQGKVLNAEAIRMDGEKYANMPGVVNEERTGKRSFFGLGKRRASAAGAAGRTPTSPIAPSSPSVFGTSSGAAAFAGTVPNSSSSATKHSQMEAVQPTPTRSSKLLRRFSQSQPGTPRKEFGKDDFPFPPPPIPDFYKSGTTARPKTSDGASVGRSASLRPTLRNHSDTSTTVPPGSIGANRPVVTLGRTGKKKRFQGLRRALGLND